MSFLVATASNRLSRYSKRGLRSSDEFGMVIRTYNQKYGCTVKEEWVSSERSGGMIVSGRGFWYGGRMVINEDLILKKLESLDKRMGGLETALVKQGDQLRGEMASMKADILVEVKKVGVNLETRLGVKIDALGVDLPAGRQE